MEQITRLLFATTFLTIFCYLFYFWSIGQAGNGGEYWGFDGHSEPFHAAQAAFERGDYRFLSIDMPDAFGNRYRATPSFQPCANHPFGSANALRFSASEPIHGADSLRLATEFARSFNDTMNSMLRDMMDYRCEVFES